MLRMYFEAYRNWGFSALKEYDMVDKNLVKIAKDVRKMLERRKKVEEVEKILYKEYYGFEEGDYTIEKEYKTIILRNGLGEGVKIILVDFDKEFEKFERKLKRWLNKYPFNQKFEVFYNRWRDGGFIGTMEEVAIGDIEEITEDDIKIKTDIDGVKAIFEDWKDYILNSDDWDPRIEFYGKAKGDKFRLVIVFDIVDKEIIEIKARRDKR
jgi:hypothetical protein